ncbi:MAG: sugar-binding domain-containing protein, partial [Chitinophagaceae bacterium]
MNRQIKKILNLLLIVISLFPISMVSQGLQSKSSLQSNLGNIPGRKISSLNGRWQAIIDPMDAGIGSWKALWKDLTPKGKSDFYEYSFEGATMLDVPGDFNSQLTELTFYESTVWYKKKFVYEKDEQKKLFIHFGAVNYIANVFLNSEKIGSHEGGFTPFQFEITDKV